MNIEIKLKTEKKVTVDFLEFGYFGYGTTIFTVDWDVSSTSREIYMGKESRLTKNTPMEESTS